MVKTAGCLNKVWLGLKTKWNAPDFLDPYTLVGGHTLPDKVFPAPMEGILSPLFCRALADKAHVRSWITPFYRVSNGGVPRTSKLKREIAHFTETGLPVIVQLMGVKADLIAEVAQRFVAMENVVGLNFNFACPSKRVVTKGGGGACMQTPDLMKEIVEKTMKACPGFQSVLKLVWAFRVKMNVSVSCPCWLT